MKITATSITQDYLSHTGTIHVSQSDYQDYMDNGPGRFAVGAQFKLVTQFFNLLPPSFAPGSYTKQELANLLGLDSYGFIMQQYSYQDNIDDYGERIYIWNSQSYKITDNALFILEANGEKRIENFGIEYWVSKNDDGEFLYENFDFESGDLGAIVGNALDLQDCIDPNNRGQRVDIIFDGQVRTRTYTATDLSDDRRKMETWGERDIRKARRDVIAVRDKVIREASIPHCLNNKKRGFNIRVSSESSIGTMMQCLSDNFHTKSDSIGDPHFSTMDKRLPREIPGVRYDGQMPGEVVLLQGTGVNDTFEIQARQELWDHPLFANDKVSINTAISMRVDGNTVITVKRPSTTTQTPTPTHTQTVTPTPSPSSQHRSDIHLAPRDIANPFNTTGLTLWEGTTGNDNVQATSGVPTLLYGRG